MLNEEWEVSDSNDLGTWNREALRDKMDGSNERGEPVKRGATRRNIVQEKSYAFALSIVKAARSIQSERREWVLSRQLIRSGTSIGANVEEAIAAQSKKDFLSKMSIALKEARETCYWLRILQDSGLTQKQEAEDISSACQELVRLLTSITLTTRLNLGRRRSKDSRSAFHIPNSSLEHY